MEAKYRRCCGIDVDKKSVTVCILPPMGGAKAGPQTKLPDLHARLETAPDRCGIFSKITSRSCCWSIRNTSIKGLNGQKTGPKDARRYGPVLSREF